MANDFWTYNREADKVLVPSTKGWYATLYCWDSEEGVLCGSHYFDTDDGKWHDTSSQVSSDPIIAFSGEPYDNFGEAYDAARLNDPEAN